MADTAIRVAALGLVPIAAPLLAVRNGSVAPGLPADAVLVTSRNALPALLAYRGTRLLAVGSATAARAREAGFADVLNADGDAAHLAALASQTVPTGARLLVAHGRGQGGALIGELRQRGFRVRPRVAYATTPVRQLPEAAAAALSAGSVHAALFLSADTARTFVRLLPALARPLLAEVDALAIGQAAADALSPLPWHRVRVSLRPTLDQVLALL